MFRDVLTSPLALIRAEAPALATISLTVPLLRLLPLPGLHNMALLAVLLLMGWRGLWRALHPDTPPHPLLIPPGWPFLAFCLRVALGIGLWVMLSGLLMLPPLLLAPHLGRHEDLAQMAGIGLALLAASLLTLAIAAAGLPPPLCAMQGPTARPGLLAALHPGHLAPHLGLILIGPLPAILLAVLTQLGSSLRPDPFTGAAIAVTALVPLLTLLALLVTCATCARIWRRLHPAPLPPDQIFG